ncbi:MAG: hypothetical protein BMS9Abin37_1754 [Acidobacteriota bacterium]|nr:MAG: hypothetical protein BMS9Abin37_1754 [Acidobacteriota bacterium]
MTPLFGDATIEYRIQFPTNPDSKDYVLADSRSSEISAELKESLLEAIQDFFDERLMPQAPTGTGSKVERTRVTDRQLQLATAVLLLEVARCDFDLRADEFKAVSRGVREVLGLTEDEATAVVRFAEEEVRQSKRLYQFTDLIDKNYSPAQKKLVVQYLWQVAFADARLVATEEYIVRKISDLLHVALADFLDAKIIARDSFR